MGRYHLCNFLKRASWETFMCGYMKFGPVVQEVVCLKVFLIWISGSPFVQRSVTICAIEGIMRNNSVK